MNEHPDLTDCGHTKIVNEIMDALIKIRIPGEQMQCLLFILRKTYGWNKKKDEIALSQFVNATGIRKPHVSRALKSLEERNIIHVTRNGNKIIPTYCFNKYFSTWKPLPKKVIVTKNDNKVSPNLGTTKDTIQKQFSPEIFCFVEKFIQWAEKEYENLAAKNTPSLLKNSCAEIEKIIRLDGFSLEYIRAALLWGSKDSFYSSQIRSLAGLRKKMPNGMMKFQNLAVKYNQSITDSTAQSSGPAYKEY